METTSVPAPHPLGPDLDMIEAFAAAPAHDRDQEGRAALALYEDVCWRLALATYTPAQQREVQRLEREAAEALRAYVQEKMPASEFWLTFLALMTELDTLSAQVDVQAQDELDAEQVLQSWRARLAAFDLPALMRQQAQTVLELMADVLLAYHNGKVVSSDFWPLFAKGESALEAVLASEPLISQEARLHTLADQVLALDVPLFLQLPIATRLAEQALAWDHGEPLESAALDELETLIGRAQAFQEVFGAAEQEYRYLLDAVARHVLSPEFAEEARDQFQAMGILLGELESGQLDPAAFQRRFPIAARRIEVLLHLHREQAEDLQEAELHLSEVREKLGAARIPRFVAQTAGSIVEVMERLIRDRRTQELTPEAFRPEFEMALKELEVTLDFGREVIREESDSLRRYEALCRRVDVTRLAPILRGPAVDLLETLRGLLHRLDTGMYPLADFHHAFDEVADRLDALLAWQTAMADQTTHAPVAL